MNREDLLALDWIVAGDGEAFWVEDIKAGGSSEQGQDARALQAEAPALALAVLAGRDFADRVARILDPVNQHYVIDLIRTIDDAIRLARIRQ